MFKISEYSYTKVVRYLECCHNNHTHTECTGQWIDPLWVPGPLVPEKKSLLINNKSEIHNSSPSIFFQVSLVPFQLQFPLQGSFWS